MIVGGADDAEVELPWMLLAEYVSVTPGAGLCGMRLVELHNLGEFLGGQGAGKIGVLYHRSPLRILC